MFKKTDRRAKRKKRHLSIRRKISGTQEKPRISVYRSLNNIFVQFIDDKAGHTLLSASSLDKEIRSKIEKGANMKVAELVGELAGKRAVEKGIKEAAFDRSGYIYTGKVKSVAEGIRKSGLKI